MVLVDLFTLTLRLPDTLLRAGLVVVFFLNNISLILFLLVSDIIRLVDLNLLVTTRPRLILYLLGLLVFLVTPRSRLILYLLGLLVVLNITPLLHDFFMLIFFLIVLTFLAFLIF